MAVDQKVRDALDLKTLPLPPVPKVIDIQAFDYVDSYGEDALRVWVTIAEETDVEKLPRGSASSLVNTIHDSLLEHGVQLFPYISFGKPSELEEIGIGK